MRSISSKDVPGNWRARVSCIDPGHSHSRLRSCCRSATHPALTCLMAGADACRMQALAPPSPSSPPCLSRGGATAFYLRARTNE
eukprot:scaffold194338_cov28-Tisochrysis_lutea.AAC.1